MEQPTRDTEPSPPSETGKPVTYQPVPPPPPEPPEALKPWYYQGWFLVPTFVWWPCSAILFIRSPWHNGVVSGALSWAWIIIGGGWIFLRTQFRMQNDQPLLDPTLLALAAPGIVLTMLTQSLWLLRDRPRIRRIMEQPTQNEEQPQPETGKPVTYQPVPPPPPEPPEALKPWYYQGWFLVPTFVWWPCSAILFIRSPWHNGVVSGALSWAWIIIGGGWIFLRTQFRMQNDQPLLDPTLLALAAPGIVLTILTQSLWLLRDRPRIRRIRDAGGFADYPDEEAAPAPRRVESQESAGRSNRRANRGAARSRRRRR